MALRIVKLSDAERDIDDLFDYIARDGGLYRAEVALRRIHRTLENLAVFPRIGRVRLDLDGAPHVFSV